MDRGPQSPGKGTHRAAVWHLARPSGERNAPSGNRPYRRCQPLLGDTFPAGVGTAFHGAASESTQCASTTGSGTPARGNSEYARRTEGRLGPHRQLGRSSLGRTTGGSLRWIAGSSGGNRTTTGWLALATLSETLSALAALPRTDAGFRKSFQPTASRTYETKNPTPQGVQTQVPCASRTSMEEAVEADTSTSRQRGHFYFALTLRRPLG